MAPPRKTRRRSPGEGGAFSYKTRAGTRWHWKALILTPDGAKKTRTKGGFTTKEAALADMREAQAAGQKGQYAEPSKQLTGPYLTEWLAGQSDLRPSTMASYRKNIRLHIEPYIGTVPLASLTSTKINVLYQQLKTSGRADHREGEGLSPRTVRYVAMILSSALAEAVETGRLARNPAAKAKPPTAEQARSPEMHPWSEPELDTFLGWSADNSRHHVAWRVLAYTGMRRGECLELRWRDWDPGTSTIKIRRSAGVVRNMGEGAAVEVGLTKTGRDRTIAVDPGTAALLRSWRLARAELGLHLVRPDSLIFSDLEGRHLHPERFSRTFQQVRARCRKVHPDLPVIRLHDLRHTHATILLRKGVPVKAVSVRLGHASAVITMTVYAGWMPADDANAAAVFASRTGS